MERRHTERISFSLDARIISDKETHHGLIENISEDGMEYMITSYIQASKDFTPDKRIGLNFMTQSGEAIELNCEVKWFLKIESHEDKLLLGMEIINPSPEYKKWVKDITTSRSDDLLH